MEISSGESTPSSNECHGRVNADSGQDRCGGSNLASQQHIPSSSSGGHIFNTGGRPNKICHSSSLGPLTTCLPNSLPGGTISSSSSSITTSNTNSNSSNNTNMAASSQNSNNMTSSSHNNSSISALNNSVPLAVPQLLNSHPRLLALSGTNTKVPSDHECNIKGPNNNTNNNNNNNTTNNLYLHHHDSESSLPAKNQLEPLTISANTNSIGGGPPTPTHSENQDGIDIRKGRSFNLIY